MAIMVLPLVMIGTTDGNLDTQYLNGSDIRVPVATVATVSNRSDFALGTARRSPATPLVLAARNDDRECYWLGTCGN